MHGGGSSARCVRVTDRVGRTIDASCAARVHKRGKVSEESMPARARTCTVASGVSGGAKHDGDNRLGNGLLQPARRDVNCVCVCVCFCVCTDPDGVRTQRKEGCEGGESEV